MRFTWFLLFFLSGCAEVEPEVCGQEFCLPTQARLVGKQEVADFNTYQVDWGKNRIGIYEGDFPDFDKKEAEAISIPIDANAKFFADSGEGHVLARLDSGLSFSM